MPIKKILVTLAAALAASFTLLTAAAPAFGASGSDLGLWKHSKEKVLYSFCRDGWPCPDGDTPEANLIFDAAGNLYGTTYSGGLYSRSCNGGDGDTCGKVFQLTRGKDRRWIEKVLHTFRYDGEDGTNPAAGMIFDAAGNLYGTTAYGGSGQCVINGQLVGCGTVFELTPRADGEWTYKVLHSFSSNGGDGYYPWASLLLDEDGNLYGTTSRGGSQCVGYWGCGTVFKLERCKKGKWTEKVLYSFGSTDSDAVVPYAALIFDSAGNMYGTTFAGGKYTYGTVFKLTRCRNGKWMEKVLHSFNLNDGAYPYRNLVFDRKGNLYGTTSSILAHDGAVFRLARCGHGEWKETVLHEFQPVAGGMDGAIPIAGMTFNAAGNLYGTTWAGGEYGGGTVFKLTRCRKGKWTEKVLYSFNISWGGGPWAGVIFDTAGNLYGTTTAGGNQNNSCLIGCGTVFELTP